LCCGAYIERFEFKRGREETLDDVMTWRVNFVERRRRTVVRTLRGDDVRISGRRSGRIGCTSASSRA
jgi:hypothetical protein